MKSSPSPRVRFLAVVALILLAGGGAYLLINGSKATSDTAGTQATLPRTTPTKTTPKQNAKPEKRKKSRRNVPVEGVNALDAALVAHPLVVVSVYARTVATDEQAMQEARAGAAAANAGFVAFNVFDEKIARQLATLLGGDASSNPEVLFFKRGRKLAFKLPGFADSQIVAQAAKNVYPYSDPWVNDAGTICRRFSGPLALALSEAKSANLDTAAGRDQAVAALNKAAATLTRETKSLSAVRANMGNAKDFARLIADLRQVATNMGSEAAALRGNDRQTATSIDQKNAALITSTGNLAAKLQIISCAS
jgi:hypothetical protein